MILPPARPNRPRRLLVPFSGSGSEMIAALRAGWDEVVGVELLGEYAVIAEARLTRWAEVAAHLEPAELERAVEADARQVDLFGNLSDQPMKEHP